MGRFNGSYRHMTKLHTHGQFASGPRGVLKMIRMNKAAEAVMRNNNTPHERTKAHRLKRCACEQA